MESIITFFAIIGLCMFVYAYHMMRRKYKKYPITCDVLYIIEDEDELWSNNILS